jgi:hypothetical protein
MQQREVFPEELMELFSDVTENNFPFDGPTFGPENTDYDAHWEFRVRRGIGILKCSLRDVFGNEEDFEWELIRKTP